MKLKLLIVGSLLMTAIVMASANTKRPNASGPTNFETRCGWFSNPTPANIWLYDREAEWTIGVQGGYQVPGDWPWPRFKSGQWVKTNGNYGYGCACLQVRVNKKTHSVLEIRSSTARPLAKCRQDVALKKWNRVLS